MPVFAAKSTIHRFVPRSRRRFGMRLYQWIVRLSVTVALVAAAVAGAGWKWTGIRQ
jgi:hypothetical protein